MTEAQPPAEQARTDEAPAPRPDADRAPADPPAADPPAGALTAEDAVVVVGAGHAGVEVAAALRELGFEGPLTVVGDERHTPYHRPPLSKGHLVHGPAGPRGAGDRGEDAQGAADAEEHLRPASSYAELGVDLVLDDAAVRVDRAARSVVLASGRVLAYAHLVLATGSRPRALPVPGADLDGVASLRTLDDAAALRELLGRGGRVVVVGGGFIGMEVAAAAVTAGHRVTVVEGLERPMARATSPELSAHVTRLHRHRGTTVLLGRGVAALHPAADDPHRVGAVELTDGELLPADVVVVGIGVVPATELAADAGLEVADGVVVDASLATSDPAVSAVGDCARYPSAHAGGPARLESVQNAVDHARFLAARLTGSGSGGYAAVPWFWTHQFDAVVQMVGIAAPDARTVVVGDAAAEDGADPEGAAFTAYRFEGDRLVCVETVDRSADHAAARRVLAGERRPGPEDVVAEGFTLRAFARARR